MNQEYTPKNVRNFKKKMNQMTIFSDQMNIYQQKFSKSEGKKLNQKNVQTSIKKINREYIPQKNVLNLKKNWTNFSPKFVIFHSSETFQIQTFIPSSLQNVIFSRIHITCISYSLKYTKFFLNLTCIFFWTLHAHAWFSLA